MSPIVAIGVGANFAGVVGGTPGASVFVLCALLAGLHE